MRKADTEVREVVCSETGKPMPKIPLWMSDIKVKFVCDEARQKSATPAPLLDVEPVRRSVGGVGDLDELKEVDAVGVMIDDTEFEDDLEDETDEAADPDF